MSNSMKCATLKLRRMLLLGYNPNICIEISKEFKVDPEKLLKNYNKKYFCSY